MTPVQQAQEFLQHRIKVLGDLFTGEAPVNEYINNSKFIAPLPAKPGVALAHEMLKSAGTEGQSKMSGLGIGGSAPIYETPFNKPETTLNDLTGNVTVGGLVNHILNR